MPELILKDFHGVVHSLPDEGWRYIGTFRSPTDEEAKIQSENDNGDCGIYFHIDVKDSAYIYSNCLLIVTINDYPYIIEAASSLISCFPDGMFCLPSENGHRGPSSNGFNKIIGAEMIKGSSLCVYVLPLGETQYNDIKYVKDLIKKYRDLYQN